MNRAAVADSEQAMSWMQAEHRVLLAALRQAADAGFDAQAWQLAWTFVTFLNRKGHWHDLLSSGEVAVRVADRLGIPAARASAHRQIGLSSSQTGRYADSDDHLHRAARIRERIEADASIARRDAVPDDNRGRVVGIHPMTRIFHST